MTQHDYFQADHVLKTAVERPEMEAECGPSCGKAEMSDSSDGAADEKPTSSERERAETVLSVRS